MPLSGTAPLLGASMALAAGSKDPLGLVAWTGVATALLGWLPANVVVLPGTMVAAGAAVTGLAAMTIGPPLPLGPLLAAGAGSVDPPGIANWTAVGTAIVAHLTASMQGVPSSFVANPLGGPVTGAGTLQVLPPIMPTVPPAAGSIDAPGIVNWLVVSNAISTHLAANGVLNSLGFTSPNGGGALVGASVIT